VSFRPLEIGLLVGSCCSAFFFGCTTTLDPTVVVGDEDGGAPLSTCSLAVGVESEYVICPGPLDFAAAALDCEARGASLAAVGSLEEDDFIATSAYGLISGNLWLGGMRDDDYVWSWPDGTIFWRGGRDGAAEADAYVRWQPGEPNDSSTVTTDPERCLALTLGGNDWNDRACSLRLPYVCERAPAG
jgi:hypothetical protein